MHRSVPLLLPTGNACRTAALMVLGLALLVGTANAAEPLQYTPEAAQYFDTNAELFEFDPPGGFYMRFRHGPNSTYAIYRTDAGRGRQAPVRLNRHYEETGIVIKGSVLFKAGYDGEFERVLRPGDAILVPKCVPHGGVFGWDDNEETILFTTFVDKYSEYGPDNLDHPPEAMAQKVHFDPDSGIAATEECATMEGAPPVTWSIEDLRNSTVR